ncbi:uncharacterized protein LOC124203536 [Daphnia pulex]|uniref:uncharacterized protein LOC124203536 n=1 Tax=Daphnia pulex TaxID=6669 RepID=UPI001EDF9B1F|nr:uncharacterized protein LOC124203536 [Daphnia pulex]
MGETASTSTSIDKFRQRCDRLCVTRVHPKRLNRMEFNQIQGPMQCLLNAEKIENLEHKVEGVNQMFEELDGKIDSLSRECLSSKQQLMEEIQKITEKETMERTKPTQLSPYVSNGSSSIITLEMADLCAKAVVVNHDVNIKNTKKSNSDNQKISSNQNNESFCCEICGKEYRLRNSLNSHMRNKHSLSSRGRPIGENNPQVEKGFWCTHCNKWTYQSTTLMRHVEKFHTQSSVKTAKETPLL